MPEPPPETNTTRPARLGVGGELGHGSSQHEGTKQDLAGEARTCRQRLLRDGAVGMADRLDAEMRSALWNIDHEMAKRRRCLERKAETMPRPADRGPAVPAIEAIVEHDAIDRPRDGKVPCRRHGDAVDGQDLGVGPPHALDMARQFRVGVAAGRTDAGRGPPAPAGSRDSRSSCRRSAPPRPGGMSAPRDSGTASLRDRHARRPARRSGHRAARPATAGPSHRHASDGAGPASWAPGRIPCRRRRDDRSRCDWKTAQAGSRPSRRRRPDAENQRRCPRFRW